MRRPKNPDVSGLLCSYCGVPCSSFSHRKHRGMGGDPQRKRTDGAAACGADHSDRCTCHGAQAHGHMKVKRDEDGTLMFKPDEFYAGVLHARGVRCTAGEWNEARWEGAEPEALDAR